jgi:hypothetical protein
MARPLFSYVPVKVCKLRRGHHKRRFAAGEAVHSTRQRPRMMIVQKFCQLLSQALVAFAFVAEDDGALEQQVLKLLRQIAPEIGRGRAKNEKMADGDIVRDMIRLTHETLRATGAAFELMDIE